MEKEKPIDHVLHQLVGGILPGDNIIWEVEAGFPLEKFVANFVQTSIEERSTVIYVSFNRSPATLYSAYASYIEQERFILVDCFSSGKGNHDKMFLDSLKQKDSVIHIENPENALVLQDTLIQLGKTRGKSARYIFDSLTGMGDLWSNEDIVLRFFGHFCPRLYDLNTLAYWLIEKDAHSPQFLAKIHHITQVVLFGDVSFGVPRLTVKKATGRYCPNLGIPYPFRIDKAKMTIDYETREDRELGLITKIVGTLDKALTPPLFYKQIVDTLASELGMHRVTLALLDKTSNKIKIQAAHGLSPEEQARGEYKIGEGITGEVVETGTLMVIPDVRQDPRFLDRTHTRKADPLQPVSFICVPLKVDNETIGALSADRHYATEDLLQKDIRLLSIIASMVSQVIKLNRLAEIDKDQILTRDEKALEELKNTYRLENIVGQSESMRRILAIAAIAAKSDASVLITGETGTGKEMIANVIHYNSPRADGPFIKVNCGALPETLLDSELFGHVKGAFTGAIQDRKGRFELANGGTLFLDEIAEMSPRLQVKLLRVLQDMEFEPVGSTKTIRVDVRVVAATNKNLKEEMRAGRFREDLYYRLNVVSIHIPPLRERREDIPPLVNYFMEKYNRANRKNVKKLSQNVLDLLLEYPWPGNVRELENCIEHAIVMCPSEVLSACFLPVEILQYKESTLAKKKEIPPDLETLRTLMEKFSSQSNDLGEARQLLLKLVEEVVISAGMKAGLSQRTLAKKLNISRDTLRKRISGFKE